MRYPLSFSRNGFLEGMVDLPRGVTKSTNFVLDPGQRPAIYSEAGKVGQELDFEREDERAWVALQLQRSNRYWQLVRDMVAAGELALTPGALPRLATKSASGLYSVLPLVDWRLAPLKSAGGAYAATARATIARMKADPYTYRHDTWDAIDLAAAVEEAQRTLRGLKFQR